MLCNPLSAMLQDMSQKVAIKEYVKVIYIEPSPCVVFRPFLLIVVICGIASLAEGGGTNFACPEGCGCKILPSYINSRAVKCSHIGMSHVPVMLDFGTVHTLDLSNNKVTILTNGTFSNYTGLTKIILSYNEVSDIEQEAFFELRMLRDIDLSYNKLESLNPEIFSSNPVLENVYLKGNPLAYLSPVSPIIISSSVSSLDLSACSLTEIYPATFSRLPKLNALDLSSNLLRTISAHTLEQFPDLEILELHNNRWTCNCDVIEVVEWIKTRTELEPAHKPIKCLEEGRYRTLWTVAGGNRSCTESHDADPIVAFEFTTDVTMDISTMSDEFPLPFRTVPHTSKADAETEATIESEHRVAPDCETGGWASLLSWNDNALMVYVILPLTLGTAVVVSLIAVHCLTKRCKVHRRRHDIEGNDNHLAAFFSDVPLLDPQLTTDPKKQHAGHMNRSSDGVQYADYHVYEQID